MPISIGDPVAQPPLKGGLTSAVDWPAVARACREHPGQWLPISFGEDATRAKVSQYAARIQSGQVAPLRGFKATLRKTVLYVQFPGGES